MRLTLAYSSDSDDAFMVRAIKEGLIDTHGLEFDLIADDIEHLNRLSQVERYDISAVSMAVYPLIQQTYWLLPLGASYGRGFGPSVVTRSDSSIMNFDDLKGKIIATPGRHTTASLAMTTLLGRQRTVNVAFDQVCEEVQSGRAEAGLLIHEVQLDCKRLGLRQITDLGSEWQKRFDDDLPLGGIVMHRRHSRQVIDAAVQVYKASIAYGLSHRGETLQASRVGASNDLTEEQADHYIDRYVNDESFELSKRAIQSLDHLFLSAKNLSELPSCVASQCVWSCSPEAIL